MRLLSLFSARMILGIDKPFLYLLINVFLKLPNYMLAVKYTATRSLTTTLFFALNAGAA